MRWWLSERSSEGLREIPWNAGTRISDFAVINFSTSQAFVGETCGSELSHWYLAEWQRQSPDDAEMLKFLAIVEFETNAYGPAVEWADKLLKQKPGDANVLEFRAKAIRRQREQLEMWESASPKKETR